MRGCIAVMYTVVALLLGVLHQPTALPAPDGAGFQPTLNGVFVPLCSTRHSEAPPAGPAMPAEKSTHICHACLLMQTPGLIAASGKCPAPRLRFLFRVAPRAPPGFVLAWRQAPTARGPPQWKGPFA